MSLRGEAIIAPHIRQGRVVLIRGDDAVADGDREIAHGDATCNERGLIVGDGRVADLRWSSAEEPPATRSRVGRTVPRQRGVLHGQITDTVNAAAADGSTVGCVPRDGGVRHGQLVEIENPAAKGVSGASSDGATVQRQAGVAHRTAPDVEDRTAPAVVVTADRMAVGEGQAADRLARVAGDKEDAVSAAPIHGQRIGTRPLDRQCRADRHRPTGQRDGLGRGKKGRIERDNRAARAVGAGDCCAQGARAGVVVVCDDVGRRIHRAGHADVLRGGPAARAGDVAADAPGASPGAGAGLDGGGAHRAVAGCQGFRSLPSAATVFGQLHARGRGDDEVRREVAAAHGEGLRRCGGRACRGRAQSN